MAIKAVILDLGNVIVPVDFRRCHQDLAEVCSCPPEDIPTRVGSRGLVQRFETGRLSPEEFVREVLQVLGMDVSYQRFWEIWGNMLAPETLLPDSLLESICQDRRLLLLSNTNAIHFAIIQKRYSLLRHFHSCVLSYEVGEMKPSPKIYQEAIARAGCLPAECFFTDDVAPFVEAARREGIDAVQFQSKEQLEEELRKRDINF